MHTLMNGHKVDFSLGQCLPDKYVFKKKKQLKCPKVLKE